MAKKAKFNSVCEGIIYEQGKVYADDAVKHLPASDFEDVEEEVTATPVTGTFADEKKNQEESSVTSTESSQNGETDKKIEEAGGEVLI